MNFNDFWYEVASNQNIGNNVQPDALIIEFIEIKEVDSADVPNQNQAVGSLINYKDKIYASKK